MRKTDVETMYICHWKDHGYIGDEKKFTDDPMEARRFRSKRAALISAGNFSEGDLRFTFTPVTVTTTIELEIA